MDDTISRQMTIDAIKQHKTAVLGDREWDEGIAYGYAAAHTHLVEIVRKLPSAERHGRWVKKYRGNYLCSVCGAWYRTTDDYGNIIDGEMTANYCESCGAKMDEVGE